MKKILFLHSDLKFNETIPRPFYGEEEKICICGQCKDICTPIEEDHEPDPFLRLGKKEGKIISECCECPDIWVYENNHGEISLVEEKEAADYLWGLTFG